MAQPPRIRQQKQPALEAALATINQTLDGLLEDPDARVTRPVLLVVGHQRAGTTLVSQLLTSCLALGYPSNFIARFWRAPAVGVTLQRALLGQPDTWTSTFTSELGTTSGLLEPHEFSYFWDHWFPAPGRCADRDRFVRAVAGMEAAFDAPLAFKNVFNTLRVPLLAELLPTAVFVRVRRDLVDVACSTLSARRHRYGTDRAWLGLRPPGCEGLDQAPPVDQIAAQIAHSERHLARGLSALPAGQWIDVDYAALCADPDALVELVAARGIPRRPGRTAPAPFTLSRPSLDHPEAAALRAALAAMLPPAAIDRGGLEVPD